MEMYSKKYADTIQRIRDMAASDDSMAEKMAKEMATIKVEANTANMRLVFDRLGRYFHDEDGVLVAASFALSRWDDLDDAEAYGVFTLSLAVMDQASQVLVFKELADGEGYRPGNYL